MTTQRNAVVRARIDEDLKRDVEQILGHLGLTMSDAIQVLFCQIKLHQGLPLSLKIPNRLTQTVLNDSAQGKHIQSFETVEALFDDLGL